MGSRAVETLVDGGTFFEGPRWHDGRWWVSDFYRHMVLRVGTDGTQEDVVEVEGQPSGLGWLADGSMIIASMKDRRLLRRHQDGTVTVHAELAEHCSGPLNDLVVDGQGRTYVGHFGFDLMGGADPVPASLLRVDPDGSVAVAAEELMFPNGTLVTPDGSTLIVAESFGNRLSAFTIGADGSLSDRRVWAEFGPPPSMGSAADVMGQLVAVPDGCSLDEDGCVWAADAAGGRCIRVAEGGAILDEVAAPDGLEIFACALGGDDGRTLLMCGAPDFFEHARSQAREAALLTTTVDVPHAGLP